MTDSEGPEGHTCPECGAPRGPDRSPSCDCTERAAQALRAARTAEAAAAEDFDPLRIRPYVEVEAPPSVPSTPPAPPATQPLQTTAGPSMPDPGMFENEGSGGTGGNGDTGGNGSIRGTGGPGGSGGSESINGSQRPGASPAPGGRHGGPGGSDSLSGTESLNGNQRPGASHAPDASHGGLGGSDEPGAVESLGGEASRPRARRAVLVCVAGASVAVVAAAGFASGLFSYHPPSRDRAAQEVRESVPDVTTSAPASPAAPSSPTALRPPVPSPSASASRPDPSATSSASPTPSTSAETSHPASPTASTPASAAPRTTPAVAPVLQRGDQGPEVTELQQRLRQLNLYGDRISGSFTRPVEDAVRTYQLARGIRGDTPGVYGPSTRKSLEAETALPSGSSE